MGVFSERKIGLYECPRCRISFPFAVGMRRLKIVAVDEWERLTNASRALTAALGRLKSLEEENSSLRKFASACSREVEIEKLEARAAALSAEISVLRGVKQGLEEDMKLLSA